MKTQQKNWIGRSTGAEVNFKPPPTGTSSPSTPPGRDTLFGATYMVIAPEHAYVEQVEGQADQLR